MRVLPAASFFHAGRLSSHRLGPARGHNRSLNAQAGFSIVEIVMATFVMTFALATSILTLQAGFRGLADARDSTLASQIMQSEIERIRLMPWDLPSGSGIMQLVGTETLNLATMFSSNPAVAAKFAVTRTVSDDETRPTEVKKIELSVTWKSFDGRPHTRRMSTIYSKNGLYDYYYTTASP